MGRTITLNDDLATRLEAEAERSHKTVDEVLDEVLKKGLGTKDMQPKRFVVRARELGVRPGVNFDHAWKLLDEIDETDPK